MLKLNAARGVRVRMRLAFRAALIALTGGLLPNLAAGQTAAPAQPDRVTFRLAVQQQATFVETRTVRKIVDFGDKKESEVEAFSQTSDVVIGPRGTGFLVTVKPRLARDWEPAGTAAQGIAAALRGTRIQYEFDGQGNLVALRGLEKFREELDATLPAALKPMMNALVPRVVEQLKDEWRSRYQGLVGQTFSIGYRQTGEVPLTLAPQLQPVTAKVARGVRARQACGQRECVVFVMGYVVENADGYGEAVAGLLREWMRQMLTGLGGAKAPAEIRKMEAGMPKLKVKELLALAERLVDPETLTVYFEKQTKGFRGVIDGATEMQWLELTTLEYKRVN